MTDKEIIIDGVDVSKCGHYHYGKCEIDYDEWNNEIIRYNECQNNPNCYYKQLKRKEQECEEYEQTLAEIRKIVKYNVYITRADLRFKLDLIKDKISEVLNDRRKQS